MEKNIMSNRISCLLIIALSSGFTLPACTVAQVMVVGSPMYTSPAFGGSVVDEATQQPLEEVIVVAHWELQRTAIQTVTVGQLKVLETLTDAHGKYQFPTWAQAASPLDHVSPDSPDLLFFKSGYLPYRTSNYDTKNNAAGPVLRSDSDGKTIALKKFTGSLEEYARQMENFERGLDFAFRHQDCLWQKIPRILIAMDGEKKLLKARQISNSLHSLEYRDKGFNTSQCGSMQKFLRSYMP
jgi:hypothetical protein